MGATTYVAPLNLRSSIRSRVDLVTAQDRLSYAVDRLGAAVSSIRA